MVEQSDDRAEPPATAAVAADGAGDDPAVESDVELESDDELDEDDADDDTDADAQFDRLEARLESMGLLPASVRRRGAAERGIVATLASSDRPVADLAGFGVAHRRLARGLEAVTAYGGGRAAVSSRLGPLRPVAAVLVQLVTGWIVAGQTNRVLTHVRRRYELREANSVWNSDEHRELRRARGQIQMLSDDLKFSIGLPVFLLSGAVVSAALGLLRSLARPVLSNVALATVSVVLIAMVLLGLAGAVMHAASVARHRLRLALAHPLTELYAALGAAGKPPRDRCYLVAVVGLACFALAAIAVPIAVYALLQL